MAKEKVELLTELKQGASQFTLVGKAVIKDGALKGVLQKEGKTWRHVNSSFGVDTGDGNSVYARIWGGYKTDKPTLKRWNSENEFIDIAWNDRLNESVALLASAWIEINPIHCFSIINNVALLVSAWIEIFATSEMPGSISVALLVSAWIEILVFPCLQK